MQNKGEEIELKATRSYMRSQKKKKERERYHQRKKDGKIKSINEVSAIKKRLIRKRWKQSARLHRKNKNDAKKLGQLLLNNTPPSTPTGSVINESEMGRPSTSRGRAIAGRKRILRKRSATVRKLKRLEEELESLNKKADRFKQRYNRLKRKSKQKKSPRTNVEALIRGQKVAKDVKRGLKTSAK